MNSTHSSAVLSMGVLVPIIHWLTTWPIKPPDDPTVAAIAALLIASPPGIKALVAWWKAPKPPAA
jgi:hypothetical protein